MWNNINNFLGNCFLVATLALGLVLVPGCGDATKPAPATQAGDTVKETAEAKPADSGAPAAAPEQSLDVPALLAGISGAKDMFAWYAARETYKAGETANAGIDAALKARESELLAEVPAVPISADLDLVGLDWKLDGTESAEGQKDSFFVTWLFRVNKDIVLEGDHDLKLVLRGWFDKAHQHYFDKDQQHFQLTYSLTPPVTEWKAGTYQRVSRKTYKQVPNVPYRLHTIFSETTAAGDYVSRYGEFADSGWFADIGKVPAPVSAP